jgi:hypothetical protein
MFREFGVPALTSETNDVDAVVYHLDGPGALQHVEALCEIPRLGVILYVPHPGPHSFEWWRHDRMPLYEQIDRLGKGQAFHDVPLEDIKSLWRRFRSRQLYFFAHAESAAQVEDMIGELEGLEKDGPD